MKTRNLFFALVVGIALATVPLAGCGDSTDDPSANNSNNVNNVNNANNDKQDVGGGEDTNNGGEDTNNGGEDTNNGGEDTNNGNNNSGDECEANTTFFGQIGGAEAPNGGTWTTDSSVLTEDAGIEAALAAIPKAPGRDTVSTTLDTPLEIREATVIATAHAAHSNGTFFVQDQNAGLRIRLAVKVSDTVRVGQKVSFDITQIQIFDGHVQVQALENFSIVSENNAVPYTDMAGVDFTVAQYNTNVRVDGVLESDGNSCGGDAKCYDLKYGEKTVTFRTVHNYKSGDCITYLGPVNLNPGPHREDVTDPTVQLNTDNFAWYRGPWVDL